MQNDHTGAAGNHAVSDGTDVLSPCWRRVLMLKNSKPIEDGASGRIVMGPLSLGRAKMENTENKCLIFTVFYMYIKRIY
jgi:hypothetical protein